MLWLKAFHIIFVVCWFAGLFYLPRILVNYAGCEDAATREQLAGMARRLYRFVTPFMYLSFGFGLGMMWLNWNYYLSAPWMWLKLAGVVALFLYHLQCGRYVAAVVAHKDRHSHTYYRFFNEVPVLFLFAIVILVVVKPF
jgi:putative membrane protein